MAVATRVISDPAMAAVLAALDMAAKGDGAALLDRRHHLDLAEAEMPGIGSPPIGSMAMEDVRDLQPRAAHGRRLNPGSRPPFGRRCEPVERAGHGADGGVSDTGVTGRGVELGVTEQHLDDADFGVLFQEVRGEAVPQGMRRYAFFDPGGLGGGVNGAVELTGRQRLARISPREQPASRQQCAEPPTLAPPLAQQLEQLRRQHGVAILATLALLDPQ